jgi:amino acid transporter
VAEPAQKVLPSAGDDQSGRSTRSQPIRAESVKRLLIGRPMAGDEFEETLLPKWLALPIFSSDPLSSVAYATEAALVVLVGVSLSARHLVLPISGAIAVLLTVVALSYRQTVKAYESSGGAYVVARENLGTLSSLVAAAALLVDYVLTVAVSIAAGIFAITSTAPSLAPHALALSLGCVGLLTLANLRGVRESGLLFAIPTYGFIASIYAMLTVGIGRCSLAACPAAHVPHPLAAGNGSLGVFILLKAFASGCAALTGTEAIANGVTAFRRPQSQNAARTLIAMAAVAASLFLGVSYLAVKMDARPSATTSVIGQLARTTFPAGSSASALFYVIQAFTLTILIFAANTAYQGFPRLAALMARDRFFPRQFINLGDRLVYSNGIVVLSSLAAALLIAFKANVFSLIHLYVVGVFTAFTISQTGMVRHWRRLRNPGWRSSALMNGLGALATGVVALIVIETKFLDGAWMVTVAIPLMVLGFYRINRHYRVIGRRLRAGAKAVAVAPAATNEVVLFIERLDPAADEALWYGRQIAAGHVRAIHVPGRRTDTGIRTRFRKLTDIRPDLDVLPVADGRADAVLDYIWGIPRGESSFVTLITPEYYERRSLAAALRRRTVFTLKWRLLKEPGVVITDVPLVAADANGGPTRAVCRVLVSGAHAASMRAINYATTLGLPDTRAVFFAFDHDEASRLRRDWQGLNLLMPLEVEEAPFRDLSDPLLRYLRAITADEQTVAVVIMPELVVPGIQRLLHNQRALYLKRLLLFEPRVILANVPYRLG